MARRQRMPRRSRRNNNRARQSGVLRVPRSHDPPGINQVPWNRVVLETHDVGPGNFKFSDLDTYFKNQCGFGSCPNLDFSFRLQWVAAWADLGTAIILQATDFLMGGELDYLAQVTDNAAANHYAHVSYRWPMNYRNLPISKDNTNALFNIGISAGTNIQVVQVGLLWKTRYKEIPERWNFGQVKSGLDAPEPSDEEEC